MPRSSHATRSELTSSSLHPTDGSGAELVAHADEYRGRVGACTAAADCKPAACKCVDGTGSDTATTRICDNRICNAKSFGDSQCKTHGGIASSATCS